MTQSLTLARTVVAPLPTQPYLPTLRRSQRIP